MRFKNTGDYLAHFAFMMIIGFLSILFSYLFILLETVFLKLSPNFVQEKKEYIIWTMTLILFYFLPAIFLTIKSLKIWSNNPKFFLPNLFSSGNQYISFDKEKFKQVIDILTIVVTFFLLISKPYSIKPFDNPFDSVLFVTYPVNLGFKLWDYSTPKTKRRKYFSHRKYK